MQIERFLSVLGEIGQSPYALVGYVVVAIIWGIGIWRGQRLRTISRQLKELPEKDRLRALELEYRLIPRRGLTPEAYLKHSVRQYIFVVVLVTVLATAVLVLAALVKQIEEKRLESSSEAASLALDLTRMAKDSVSSNEYKQAAGRLETILRLHPSPTAYNNLGHVYEMQSQTERSLLAYEEALKLDPKNIEALIATGYQNKDMGNLEKAKDVLEKAQRLTLEGNQQWFVAMVNLGAVKYEMGRETNDADVRAAACREALSKYYVPAKRYQSKIEDRDLVAKLYVNMANCYKDTEEFDTAEALMIEGLAIKRRLAASRSLADTLVNMADLHLKLAAYSQAKPYLREAVPIFEVIGNQVGLGAAFYNLGDIEWAGGRKESALAYYKRAVDSFALAEVGGEYEKAARRRVTRMNNDDPPAFVLEALERRGRATASK